MITDELREYVGLGDGTVPREIRAIADRIDAEHERKVGCTADEWDYWESTHFELPKDADGEPWHINDEFEIDEGIVHVNGIGDNRLFYIDNDGMQWTRADNKLHYYAPTVEDVLREFGAGWYKLMNAPETFDIADYVERYAAKLMLKED